MNNYKTKVLKGEWKGYAKKSNNSSTIKSFDENMFIELANKCENLQKNVNTLKASKLDGLEEILEKDIFISSATSLRKEMRLLDETLQERLKDKGYVDVEHRKGNRIFEMPISGSHGKSLALRRLREEGMTMAEKESALSGAFSHLYANFMIGGEDALLDMLLNLPWALLSYIWEIGTGQRD